MPVAGDGWAVMVGSIEEGSREDGAVDVGYW